MSMFGSAAKSRTGLTVVAETFDNEASETSTLVDKTYKGPFNRANSYSSTYETEINELQFTKSRVEHDSYYLSPAPDEKRHLGVGSVFLMMISKMMGSGIFATPAIIYRNVDGSPILFFLCWLIAALVGYGGMRVYLEFSTLIDKNGGSKTYLQFLYGRPKMMTTCIVSLTTMLFGFGVVNAVIFSKYTLALFEIEETQKSVNYLALALIALGTVLYGTSVKHAVYLQNVIGVIKLVLIAVMTVSSIVVILPSAVTGLQFDKQLHLDSTFFEIDYENFRLAKFASAVLKAIFTMNGYQSFSVFTGEVVNSKSTLKIACPSSLFFMFTCFVLINIAYVVIIPRDEFMQSDELVGALLFSKIFGSSFGTKFLTASVAFSCFGNVLIGIYGFGRNNQEVFREGFLPFSRFMGSDWPKKAPLPGLLVSFIISVLILVFPPNDDIYDFIINLDSYPTNFFALVLGLGIFIVRKNYSYLRSTIKAPLWSTAVYCFSAIFLMVSPLIGSGGDKLYAYCGIVCLLGCVSYWFIYFKLLPWVFRYDLVETIIETEGGTIFKEWQKVY